MEEDGLAWNYDYNPFSDGWMPPWAMDPGSIPSDGNYYNPGDGSSPPTAWTGLDAGTPAAGYNPAYDPGTVGAETYEQYAAGGGANLVAQWSGTQNGYLINNCIYDLGDGVRVQAVLGRTCPQYLSLDSAIIQGGTILNDNQ